jgi:hypothetical protein
MKIRALILALCTAALSLGGCLKEPGMVQLTCNVSSTTVGQTVTYTVTGAENFTCIEWSLESGPSYTVVSGGTTSDLTMSCRFNATGRPGVHVKVKNCKKGCDGRCTYSEATLFIDVN